MPVGLGSQNKANDKQRRNTVRMQFAAKLGKAGTHCNHTCSVLEKAFMDYARHEGIE